MKRTCRTTGVVLGSLGPLAAQTSWAGASRPRTGDGDSLGIGPGPEMLAGASVAGGAGLVGVVFLVLGLRLVLGPGRRSGRRL